MICSSGRRDQVTKRGYRTAAEAAKARRELFARLDRGQLKVTPAGTTINELLDLYLDGLDADARLSAKTRFGSARRRPGPAGLSRSTGARSRPGSSSH